MRNKKLIVLFCILFVITILVVLGSVLFSVQTVYGYCYNDGDEALIAEVIKDETTGIEKGKSIFLLDEEKIISSIESKVPNIEVINIERKFPNRVYVNFVRIFPYLVLESGENALVISNDGKIVASESKRTEYDEFVKVLSDKEPVSSVVGSTVFEGSSIEQRAIAEIMDTMERIDLHSVVVDMFEFIDITELSTSKTTFIKTRTGAFFEIQGSTENLGDKLSKAVSVYISKENDFMTSGTIIVSGSGEVTRSPYNRYDK